MATVVGAWARLAAVGIGLNTWVTKTPMPATQSGSSGGFGTASDGSSIWLLNGSWSTSPTTRMYRYDIATDTWTYIAQTSVSARVGMWGAYASGEPYFGAQNSPNSTLNRGVFRYNTGTNTWTTLSSLPTSTRWASTAVLPGAIHVLGGWNSFGNAEPLHVRYDIAANTASFQNNTFMLGGAGVASVIGGKIVLVTPSGNIILAREWNPAGGNWVALANLTPGGTQGGFFQGAGDGGSGIIVAGGATAVNTSGSTPIVTAVTAATYKYDRTLNAWSSALAPMPAGRAQGSSARGNDGRIYVIAGTNGTANQPDLYAYNP